MTVSIVQDSLRQVSAAEAGGYMTDLTLAYIVTSDNAASDFGTDALSLFAVSGHASVDQPGDQLSEATGNDQGEKQLFVIGRDFRFESPGRCDVRIRYKMFNVALHPRASHLTIFEPLLDVAPIQSQTDRQGSPILVTRGGHAPQYGEISAMNASVGFRYPMAISTDVPGILSAAWTNTVNEGEFLGGAPGTWLCRNASYRPLDARHSSLSGRPRRWVFDFEFIHDSSGWQPWVFWKDSATGRPPDDLVSGQGYKKIDWHQTRIFGEPGTIPYV